MKLVISSKICFVMVALFLCYRLEAQDTIRLKGEKKFVPSSYSYSARHSAGTIMRINVDQITISARTKDTTFDISFDKTTTRTYHSNRSRKYCEENYSYSAVNFVCNYDIKASVGIPSIGITVTTSTPPINMANYLIEINDVLQTLHGTSRSSLSFPDLQNQVISISWPAHYTNTNVQNLSISLKRNFRKIYHFAVFEKHPGFFYGGINVAPSVAYRTVRINEAQFTHANAQQLRNETERSAFGYNADFRVGYSHHSAASGYKSIHTVYAAGIVNRLGFKADSAGALDWKQGIDTGAAGRQEYRFENWGFGIGYNYTQYKHLFNGCFETQLNYLWLHSYNSNQVAKIGADNVRSVGLRGHTFGGKIAAGISCRPNYWIDIHIMPAFYYNLSSANNATILRSNLYNFGLETGVSFRWMRNKYQTK